MNEQLQRAIDAAVKGISDEVIGCDFGEMPPDEYDKKRFTTIVTSHIQPEFDRTERELAEAKAEVEHLDNLIFDAVDDATGIVIKRFGREQGERENGLHADIGYALAANQRTIESLRSALAEKEAEIQMAATIIAENDDRQDAELKALRASLATAVESRDKAVNALAEIMAGGVEHDDPRLAYKVMQVDNVTIEKANAVLTEAGREQG